MFLRESGRGPPGRAPSFLARGANQASSSSAARSRCAESGLNTWPRSARAQSTPPAPPSARTIPVRNLRRSSLPTEPHFFPCAQVSGTMLFENSSSLSLPRADRWTKVWLASGARDVQTRACACVRTVGTPYDCARERESGDYFCRAREGGKSAGRRRFEPHYVYVSVCPFCNREIFLCMHSRSRLLFCQPLHFLGAAGESYHHICQSPIPRRSHDPQHSC